MAAAEMFAQPLFKTPFSLTGTGGENERVMSDPVELSPGSTYLFSFGARRAGSGSGSVIAGPACLNVDWQISNPTPEINRFVFRTQEGKPRMERFHLGGWQMTGTIVFESASVRPVKAVWGKVRGITLGHGESLAGNVYSFTAPLGGFGRNDSRPLLSHTAWFNTHRWCLGGGQHVTYRHALENYVPRDMNKRKTVVAWCLRHRLYLPLVLLYQYKNRNY